MFRVEITKVEQEKMPSGYTSEQRVACLYSQLFDSLRVAEVVSYLMDRVLNRDNEGTITFRYTGKRPDSVGQNPEPKSENQTENK